MSSFRIFCPAHYFFGVDTEVGKVRLTLVLTIKLNPSLIFLIFVAHGRHTRSEKLEILSARIPVFRSVSDNIVPFTCLFTFAIVSGFWAGWPNSDS